MPQGVHLVVADVGTREGVADLATAALDLLGGADILVNNAGESSIHPGGPLSIPDEEWEIAERANLTVRTVEQHLSSAYRKPGISGRAVMAYAMVNPCLSAG